MRRIWVRILRTLSLIFSFIILTSLLSGTETSLVADLAGNPLAAEVAWTFQVKEPVLWISDADGFWDVGSKIFYGLSIGSLPRCG